MEHLNYRKFIKKIATILSNGFIITPNVIDFVESTYSIGNPEILLEILKKNSSEEYDRDMLVELIVYPGDQIQASIEADLEVQNFDPEDEMHVIQELLRNPIKTIFRIDNELYIEDIPLPDYIVEKFVKRLNILKEMPPSLLSIINNLENFQEKNLIKVKLRNARFTYSENIVRFLIIFFNNYPIGNPFFFPCQDFLYEFFREIPTDDDLMESLHLKIKFYEHQIQKTEQLNALIENSNIETMMLQGNTISGICIAEAKEKIDLIRSIILYVYNIIIDIYNPGPDVKTNDFLKNLAFEKIKKKL